MINRGKIEKTEEKEYKESSELPNPPNLEENQPKLKIGAIFFGFIAHENRYALRDFYPAMQIIRGIARGFTGKVQNVKMLTFLSIVRNGKKLLTWGAGKEW